MDVTSNVVVVSHIDYCDLRCFWREEKRGEVVCIYAFECCCGGFGHVCCFRERENSGFGEPNLRHVSTGAALVEQSQAQQRTVLRVPPVVKSGPIPPRKIAFKYF